MALAKHHVYLEYGIYENIRCIGSVHILIDKLIKMNEWKNPHLLTNEAIEYFKEQNPIWSKHELKAYYQGDLIPDIP